MPRKESPGRDAAPPGRAGAGSKKDQILALYASGTTDIAALAAATRAKPSYVASVLQEAGGLEAYFDLYTHTSRPMNVYSRLFEGKVGFRDLAKAQASVAFIGKLHDDFAANEDRAGQHHALTVALTMFDRARWSGKAAEAEIFRKWLIERLREAGEAPSPTRARH